MTTPNVDETVTVETIDRDEFLRDYWDYRAGQHVTIIGPNNRGKSTLGFQLLNATVSKKLHGYVLVSKARDETIDNFTKQLRFKTIETYPPPTELLQKQRGYMLRPYQSLKDLKADNARLHQQFKTCMMDCYGSKKPIIIFADEVQELQTTLNLKQECEAYWKRGRSLQSGLWALAQRSAYNSQDMYNAPEHLFLFNDPDKRNRMRFAEIGGVNPEIVMNVTGSLTQFQTLYIKRTGPHLCIVNP